MLLAGKSEPYARFSIFFVPDFRIYFFALFGVGACEFEFCVSAVCVGVRRVKLCRFSFGVSDELVRAAWALYHDAQASVRSSEGFGLPFPNDVGTREGGAESPHLHVIYVCSVVALNIAFFNSVALRDRAAL